MNTKHAEIDALNAQAKLLDGQQQPEAFDSATQALALSEAETPPYLAGIARAMTTLASVHERRGELHRSVALLLKVVNRIEEAPDLKLLLGEAYYLLGWNYYHLGDYAIGLQYAIRQTVIAEAAVSTLLKAQANNLMGALYGEIDGKESLAISHYEQSLALFRELNESEDEAVLLSNLCVATMNIEAYDSALDYGLQALELSRRIGNEYAEALALSNLSVVYRKLNQHKEALEVLRQQLAICQKYQFGSLENHALLSLGRICLASGELDKAFNHLQAALKRAEDSGNLKWTYQAHEELSAVCEQRGEYREALAHHKAFHQHQTKALNEQTQYSIENLRLSHEIDNVRQGNCI